MRHNEDSWCLLKKMMWLDWSWLQSQWEVVWRNYPTTNPTSTAIFKFILWRLVIRSSAFHPSAQEFRSCSTNRARDAAIAAGAPENCVQWITALIYDPTFSGETTKWMQQLTIYVSQQLIHAKASLGWCRNVPALWKNSHSVKQRMISLCSSHLTMVRSVLLSKRLSLTSEVYDEFQVAEFKSYHTYFVNKKEKLCWRILLRC